MYVEIGNYQVQEGELLPTKNITDTYVFEWETSKNDLYTILMIDLDAPYPENPVNSPFLHFMMVNISDIDGINKEGDVVFEYIPPSPPSDSEPHQYEIYVFKQACRIYDVYSDGRTRFNIDNWTDCPLKIVEKFSFFGVEDIKTFEEQLEVQETEYLPDDVFDDYYGKVSHDDLLILADLYGIDNADSLSPEEIRFKINQILSYKKEMDK